ncbi:1-phosphofructokinase, partial [Kocuria sp. HSID17590]
VRVTGLGPPAASRTPQGTADDAARSLPVLPHPAAPRLSDPQETSAPVGTAKPAGTAPGAPGPADGAPDHPGSDRGPAAPRS